MQSHAEELAGVLRVWGGFLSDGWGIRHTETQKCHRGLTAEYFFFWVPFRVAGQVDLLDRLADQIHPAC